MSNAKNSSAKGYPSKTHVGSTASANLKSGELFSKRRLIIVGYLLLVACLVTATFMYSKNLENDLLNASYVSLEKQTNQQKIFIVEQIQAKIQRVELFAGILSLMPTQTLSINEVARIYDLNTVDEQYFIIDTEGMGVAPSYGSVDISTENYFQRAKEGHTVFSQMFYTTIGDSFFIITPIRRGEVTLGYLADEVTVNYLTTLLSMSEGDYDYTYILDMSGNTIALNDNAYVLQPHEALPRVLQGMEFHPAGREFVTSYAEFENKFLSGQSGFLEINQKNNTRLGYFTPVGFNSWTLVSFLPMEAVSADLLRVSQNFYVITFIGLMLVGVFIVGLAVVYVRSMGLKDKLVRELMSRAETDPLTKLYTKNEVEGRVKNYLSYTADSEKSSMFIVDVDNFKEVNMYFGEEYGDVILKEVAQKIKSCFRASDLVARVDGNQFLVFMQAVKTEAFLPSKAELINEALKNTHIGNKNIVLTASIGMSVCPKDGTTYEGLYEKADLAMYYVKQQGKGAYAFYNKEHRKIALQAKNAIAKQKAVDLEEISKNQFLDVGNLQSSFVSLMYSSANTTLKFEEILRKLCIKYSIDRGAIIEYDNATHAINSIAEYHAKDLKSLFGGLHTYFVETKELALKPLFESSAVVQVYPDINEESESLEEKFFNTIGVKSLVAISFTYERKKGLLILSTDSTGHIWKRNDYDLMVFVARLYSLYKRSIVI